ncbi:AMP-binding protein [Allomuricauda sp. NBRC 101325]|uniref:AMP-binding protein n=1 Tax=Allomuricauda sp. NBRC 101325 TaxID=1113758 RepID=UPI0024A44C70|nr:AMP-binding protein [Muricauda sp. NBRC 101325]GLU44772.1 AMP-binding protein [Muricauda sp. NBRC 101325]
MENFQTPLEAFFFWLEKNPKHIFLRQPIHRKFIEYTRKDAYDQAIRIASALHKMGLKKGDHVALLSKNCAHWFMADLAMMLGGFISVPLYPTLDKDSIHEILVHSESKAIIIGKLDDYKSQKKGIPDIPKIGVALYGISEEFTWEDLVGNASDLKPYDQNPEDLISIMYTSGTTGNPKGVMHKVKSFNLVVQNGIKSLQFKDESKFFSYLPLSHIAERIGLEMGAIYGGGTVSFPESLETFAEDLAAVQPNTFFAVPRIWQKFQEGVLNKMPQKKLDKLLSIPIINKFVRNKIKKKLGLGDAQFCASGAAPIAVSLQKWYKKLGVEIHQCYGMTEDCILSHFNLPGTNKFGTVGRPLPGVTSKLSAEGEILIKSEALMVGYYKSPDQTAEMFTDDGFLRTGDLGEFDHDGYLAIVGRIKDQFKTDKGKYVTPSLIELELSKNTDLEHICVVGTGISQPIVLIIPSEAGRSKGNERLNESILNSIDELNPHLKKHEKIEKAVIMKENWTVDNGLMTPSMKIRRNRIEAIHQPMYLDWFSRPERVVYESV